MEIELFEHNEKAYQKLINYFKNNQMASIDHATGTGKSFITLKYLYNNRNKRILYLTPTYYIYNQLKEQHMPKLKIDYEEFIKLENIIYSNLLKLNMEDIAQKYDIIVLDEYHRCGATLWGTKIKELLSIIKEKYPEKKVLGLTATPTRYLDNERNMNEELFLGNKVSTLTLADAILDGLLPPPTYVNTANAQIEYLEYVKNKLRKKIIYQEDRRKYQDILDDTTKKIRKSIELKMDRNIELPRENGKYIVFCSKISEIKENQEKIRKKFGNKKLSFYEVHSAQKKEKNESELKKFREENDSNNFIFVVDILNEGIHVDNIDGIFLMRKTQSPIIYFQQLGRLLSYSTKQKKLVVWDMVDNIRNHQVVYNLYQEVISEAKKRLITDQKNESRYNQIISNFKIIDNYTEIMSQIKKIETQIEQLTDEELLRIRISRFVEILCHQYKNITNIPRKVQIQQLFKANEDLYKYYKYLTKEQIDKLRKANIKLPQEIDISEEELENKLLGFNTLHEKEINKQLNIFNTLKDYVEKSKKIPSIISTNQNEQEYAYLLSNMIKISDKKIKTMYKLLIEHYAKNDFDKYYYFQTHKEIDYDNFFKSLDYCLLNDIPVNKNIQHMFARISCQKNIKEKYNIKKYIGKLKYKYNIENKIQISFIEEVLNKEKNQQNQDAIKLSKLQKYGLESIEEKDIKLFVEKYYNELIQFIELKQRYPHNGDDDEYKKYNDFRPFLEKYGYKKEIDKRLSIIKENNQEELIDELIEFMMNNNGDYPSDRVLDEEELKLYQKTKKHSQLLKYYQLKLDELKKEIRIKTKDNWIEEYINFIKERRRYPVIQSNDEYEKRLIIRYLRNENYLTKEQKKAIKTIVNEIGESEIIKNTFIERKKVRRK